jgi:hypothetical protein
MDKYDPLYQWLQQNSSKVIRLSFVEIENILGSQLPTSAHVHTAWWSNAENRDTRHVQCKAWLDAGFRADADVSHRVAVFSRQ